MESGIKMDILDCVAPCGLVCYTCMGCNHGVIKQLSGTLLHYLDGYESFVASNEHKDLSIVNHCMQALGFWARQDCPGCRYEDHQCQNRDCVIRACTRSQGYDFCAECESFPCGKVHERREFADLWRHANTRIREIGVEAFFDEEKKKSQYTRFIPESEKRQ